MKFEEMFPPKVHRFSDSLKQSVEFSKLIPWTEEIYPDYFGPTFMGVVPIPDGDNRWQRDGIDRIVLLADGQQVWIDEKVRPKDYGDIFLERWSVYWGPDDPRNKDGWTCDPKRRNHLVAYAVLPCGRVYLMAQLELRRAFEKHKEDWRRVYGCRKVVNKAGYLTIGVGVPPDVVFAALNEQMVQRFRQKPPPGRSVH